MTAHTQTTEAAPPMFRPANPDALYTAMLAEVPNGECPSQWWASQYCHYVAEKGNKNTDRRAKEMRWMAREWRARKNGAQPPAPQIPALRACDVGITAKGQRKGNVVIHPAEPPRVPRTRVKHGPEFSAQQIADRAAAEGRRQERQARQALFAQAYEELGQVCKVASRFGVADRTVREALMAAGVTIARFPSKRESQV